MSSRTRVLKLATLFSCLLAMMASSPAAQGMAPQLSGQRIHLVGCSVLPPEGTGWLRQQASTLGVFFGTRHEARFHSSVAYIGLEEFRDSSVAPESWLAETRAWIVNREMISRKRKPAIEILELQLDTTLAPFAARYRYEYEDAEVPGMKGQVAMARASGVRILHPFAPLAVDCVFSERAPKGTAFEHGAIAAGFLAGLQLTRPDVSLDPSVRAERGALVIARGPDALWVASSRFAAGKALAGELLRMDPVSLAVTGRVQIGLGPSDIAVTDDAIWVAHDGEGTVLRVDPATLAVARKVKVGKEATRLAISGALLWVTDREEGGLWRIDRAQGIATRLAVKGLKKPFPALVRDGLLWVADRENQLVVLDATSGTPAGAVVGVGPGPRHLASGAGSVWVLCRGMRAVQRVDPETRRVVATIPLPHSEPGMMAFHEGALWVTDGTAGTLTRIDPATNSVASPSVQVGVSVSMCAAPDGLWICDTIGERIGRFRPATP